MEVGDWTVEGEVGSAAEAEEEGGEEEEEEDDAELDAKLSKFIRYVNRKNEATWERMRSLSDCSKHIREKNKFCTNENDM